LKGKGDKRISRNSEIQEKLKILSRETQGNWNFAKINAERKHQRFINEAPQKAWKTKKFSSEPRTP